MKSLIKLATLGFSILASSLSMAAPMTHLLGDKDCFGIGGACVEDGSTWLPGGWGAVTQGPGDPSFSDVVIPQSTVTQSWTHTVAAGSYSSASVTFRTAGIADIRGPYEVYVDGTLVGAMPYDGFGHILVETFTFAFDASLLADGSATVSFTPQSGDTWAIDYSEISYDVAAAVSEPANLALFALGLAGLGFARRRQQK